MAVKSFAEIEPQDEREPAILAAAIGCKAAIAESLIQRYGSLWEAVSAAERYDPEIPRRLRGRIASLRLVTQSLTREQAYKAPSLCSGGAVLNYCRAVLAHLSHEEFHVIFLDVKNRVIKMERLSRGTVDHAPVYPREVVKRALHWDSCAVLIIHNHPSGDPTPSRADIDMTTEIIAALKTVNIAVHDHIVIGRTGHASLKGLGLI